MPAALKKRPALASPAPRSRRERRARAEPAIVRHLVMPGLEVGSATAKPRETVTAFLRRTRWAARDRQYGWQFKKGLPSIGPPTIVISDKTVALQSLIDGLQYQVTTLQDRVADQSDQVTQLLALLSANLAATGWLDKKQLRSELFAQAGDAKASITELKSVVVDQQTAFAEFQTTVSATFGDAFSSVNTVTSAVATLDGIAAASWGVEVDGDGNIASIKLLSASDGTSSFRVLANNFQVGIPGIDAINVFTTGLIGGVPTAGINGNLILTGTITASMMDVGTLTAISAHLGNATVDGQLTSTNGKMVHDFTVGFIDLFDNS